MPSSTRPISAAALVALIAAALAPGAGAAQRNEPRPARFVRIELAGPARILQLSEVWVLAGGVNLALEGKASQSSTFGTSGAELAIDGRVSGNHSLGSVSHTAENRADPWWELDLGSDVVVDQVTVFNRTDCCGDRMEGFRIALLDASRATVLELVDQPAPLPRFDWSPYGAAVVTLGVTGAERAKLQPLIDRAIDRGVEHLRGKQLRDGSWAQHQDVHFDGQTSLSLLTLVKAGVPADDPAVEAAIAFLQGNGSSSTYGSGCLLMALAAIGDPAHAPWAERVAEALIDTQGARDEVGDHAGAWSYPVHPNSIACLSNTQYAILGLAAAKELGVKVPEATFRRTIEVLHRYRGPVETAKGEGDKRSHEVGGFMYRAEGGHGGTSGSMTTAALAISHLCRTGFRGEFPRRYDAELSGYEDAAWRWLERNFAVDHNPGRPTDWHYYYLYGLERVCAFYDRTLVGDRDWYWEGARYLVDQQRGGGEWGSDTDTCFAILFLKRATASKSGPSKDLASVHVSEAGTSDVAWRGVGDRTATFWITGFGRSALELVGGPSELRVRRVEYAVDGEVLATVDGDPSRAWKPGDRFAAKLELGALGAGKHVVTARVTVLDPSPDGDPSGYMTLEGEPIPVETKEARPAPTARFGSHASENLIQGSVLESVTASSQHDDGTRAELAADGFQGTTWLAAKDDATPALTLEFDRPLRATRVLLSHANLAVRQAGERDRATAVEVRFNREPEAVRYACDAGDLDKAELVLPRGKQIRRLEIRIVERATGRTQPGMIGFAEVELLADPVKARR